MAQNGKGGDRRDAHDRSERSLVPRSAGANGGGRRGDGGGGERFRGFGEPFGRSGDPFRIFDDMSSSLSSRMSSMFQDDQLFNDPFFTEPFGRAFGNFSGSFSARGGRGGGGGMDRNSGGGGGRNVHIEEIPRGDDYGRGGSSNEPIVEHPDDEGVLGAPLNPRARSFVSNFSNNNPENSYSFQSSTVYSAGPDGPQYAARATRRKGPEGIVEEEFQEKDSRAKKATHRISHGLGTKGLSLTRKKQGDNPEERFQTLHNLVEDEVPSFNKTWESKAQTAFPKWDRGSSLPQIGSSSKGHSRPGMPSNDR